MRISNGLIIMLEIKEAKQQQVQWSQSQQEQRGDEDEELESSIKRIRVGRGTNR